MDDIVYCTCRECPWSDCERHLSRLKGRNEKTWVSGQIWAEYAADISTGSLNVPIENIRKDRISKDE